ncbi:MAG: RNA polymerase sigma factor [Armatimonadota bacterium]
MANSEVDLIARARSGDLSAFDELISLHQEHVFALAKRILGNYEDSADVQQETFVRVWRSLHKFRWDSEFGTWLHRITINLCLTYKKRKREIPTEEELFRDFPDNSDELTALRSLERNELLEQICHVLQTLPAHYRVLIVLREIEGRSFSEISKLLGCSEASARTRATRARQLLKEKMQPYLKEAETQQHGQPQPQN